MPVPYNAGGPAASVVLIDPTTLLPYAAGASATGPGTAATATRVTYASDGSSVPVTSAAPTSVSATITSGTALSSAAVVNGKVSSITFPAAWTAAAVTFQGSTDGGATYRDLFDIVSGTATETTVSSASVTTLTTPTGGIQRNLRVSLVDWISYTHIKIRSGTAAAPVNQGADRIFIIGLAG